MMAVMFLFISYTVIEEIWNLKPPFIMIEREIQSTKAFFTYYTVSVQLLEWTCLCSMVNFQAREENQGRILITRDQYQRKETHVLKIFQAIHVLVAILFILSYPIVYLIGDPNGKTTWDDDQYALRQFSNIQLILYLLLVA